MSRPRIDWRSLHRAALDVLPSAYAPYSDYAVASAVLCTDGRVFTGVNVENASYGLTLCAERNALTTAVTAGARSFSAVVVVVAADVPAMPCGACRQVLWELAPGAAVRCYGATGSPRHRTVAKLLPDAFGRGNLGASKRARPTPRR